MANYWIKLYHETLDDPKMATLPDILWRRVIELFLFAGRLYQDGNLPDTKQIAWGLRMDQDTLENELQKIVITGIIEKTDIGWFIPKFKLRQDPAPAKERKAAQRIRDQQKQYYGDEKVTQLSRSVTQITDNRIQNTDNISETKTENHRFVGEFLRLSEIPGISSEFQGNRLVELKDKYGEKRLLQYAEWCKRKQILIIEDALKAAPTALSNWKEPAIIEPPKKRIGKTIDGEVIYG